MFKLFWHDKDGGTKCPWLSWNKCCFPYEEGGFGLRNVKEVALAFGLSFSGDLEKTNVSSSLICIKHIVLLLTLVMCR